MHSKSDNKEIITNDEVNKVIKELFDALKKRHQNNLESIKDNEFFIMFSYCIINVIKEVLIVVYYLSILRIG